jgi:hypothetical protein
VVWDGGYDGNRTVKGAIIRVAVSGGGSVVFVDEATEPVATADRSGQCWRFFSSLTGIGRLALQRTMWPLAVVVVDVDAEDTFEVATVEEPVQTRGAHGPNEALRDSVRVRRSHGRLHNPDASAAEHLVELALLESLLAGLRA